MPRWAPGCLSRLNELQVVKSKLAESDAERQRQAKEIEELSSKLQWLTKINKQVRGRQAVVLLP